MIDENVKEAKKSINSHIKFLKSLRNHMLGNDHALKSKAMWTAWCLHQYINHQLMNDVLNNIEDHGVVNEK